MPVYIHETVDLAPEAADAFLAAFRAEYQPASEALGMALVGLWQTDLLGTAPRAIALWELPDWGRFAAVRRAEYEDAAPSPRRGWYERAPGVRDVLGRVLFHPPDSQPEAPLPPAGASHSLLHALVTVEPGKLQSYLAAVNRVYLPIARRHGRTPLGLYAVRWRNREAILLWGLDSWAALFERRAALEADPAFQSWRALAVGLRTDWQVETLTPVPAPRGRGSG
jgi:hypothetical protein